MPKKPRLDIPMIGAAVIQVSLTIDEKTFWIKQGRSQGWEICLGTFLMGLFALEYSTLILYKDAHVSLTRVILKNYWLSFNCSNGANWLWWLIWEVNNSCWLLKYKQYLGEDLKIWLKGGHTRPLCVYQICGCRRHL